MAPKGIDAQGNTLQRKQRLRLKRFGMALSTYAVVALATVLITQLGLGKMAKAQWLLFIGLGIAGNGVFFLLFVTQQNLRFPDPSLTREQIVYSAFWGMVPLYCLPDARPIVLMFYVPAFSFGMLRLTRGQYLLVAAIGMGLYASILALSYVRNPYGFRGRYELFLFAIFGILLSWFCIFGGFVSTLRRRLREQKNQIQKANDDISKEIEDRRKVQIENDALIVELKEAVSRVKTLSGLLPICTSCKKIRDDQGYWKQIETYIHDHSDAVFSHSICPECSKTLYPDLFDDEGG
ncbi:MAG: hypothetical protein PVH30_07695 [Desulfobacterales bacterium]|jgi:hypothetical protein